ncbi:unnamed protein product, partial [Discosporangium mesarthrocarpum]
EGYGGWGAAGDRGFPGLEEVGGGAEGKEEEEKIVVCQRCYKLRHYGSVSEALRPGFSDSDLLTPQRFQDLLGGLRGRKCLVVYLVDLFDFHGSFLYNLPRIIGDNPVMVGGNKMDLLPRDLSKDRVRQWVRDKCRENGLRNMETKDVHLISCVTGYGIAALLRKGRGKGKGRNSDRQQKRGVTVSNIPGTTLDFLKVDLGDRRSLFDTPGLLLDHTITSRLNADELKAVIPNKRVRH